MRISDWSSDVCSSDLHDLDARADGIAVAPQLIHIGFEFGHNLRIGRIKGIVGYLVPGLKGNRDGSELAHLAAHLYSVILFQPLLGDGASRNAGCGQAGRRTSASARVALAELAPIGDRKSTRLNYTHNCEL